MSIPYQEGYDANRDGVPSHSNPYQEGTADHNAWRCGWSTAYMAYLGEDRFGGSR